MPVEDLIRQFSLDRIAKNPGVFDIQKLNWMNGHYIRQSSDERILDLAMPHLQKAGFVGDAVSADEHQWLLKVIATVKDHLEYVGQVVVHTRIFFEDQVDIENEEGVSVLAEDTVPSVLAGFRDKLTELDEWTPENIQAILKSYTKELKLGGKKVYMPIRVALTGETHGPELHHIIPLLGRKKVLNRLAR